MKPSLIIALLFLLSGACKKESAAFLNKEITLHPNTELTLGNHDAVKLKVVEINDSRCPEGVTCIWQGFASVLIKAIYQDKDSIDIDLCLGACTTVGKSSVQVIDIKGATYKVKLLAIEKDKGKNLKAIVMISKL